MLEYLFVRADVFYIVDLRDDEDAVDNAHCNPGTIRVEALNGDGRVRVVWQEGKTDA